MNRNLSGLGLKHFAFDPDNIADIQFFEIFIKFFTQIVSGYIGLDRSLQILDTAERGFSHNTLGHHTSCQGNLFALKFLKSIFDFHTVVCHIIFRDLERILPICLQIG